MKEFLLKNIFQIDKSNMLEHLLGFPQQCQKAKTLAADIELNFRERDFNKIIFLGMGGSAIGGDLLRSYLYREIDIPILVFREYQIPRFLDKNSLVFVSSYSGNTEETISAYQQAKEGSRNIIVISSGGRLKELSLKDRNTFIQIPTGLPPRCALGYLGILPLAILERIGLIKKREYEYREIFSVLENLKRKYLCPEIDIKENIAKQFAFKIYNKLPVLYTASLNFEVVVSRFRAQLNENAKCLAMSNILPEMNHNEIQGLINLKKIFKDLIVIFLKDEQIHPQVKKRIKISAQIIKEKGIAVSEINSKGKYLLSRILSLIYITDFISFYLALLYRTDPTPVETISYLKERLKD